MADEQQRGTKWIFFLQNVVLKQHDWIAGRGERL